MILLRRYKTKIVKKQPTLEASEIFPTEKSTSNKLCTVLPTVVFFNISILKKQPTLEASELACGRQGFSARKINQQ
jgi:hypothetical protein